MTEPRRRRQDGGTLAGLLVALTVAGLLAGLAAARLRPAGRGAAAVAAARDLAGRFRALSAAALADGRDRALVFPASGADEPIAEAVDLDGDGIQRADLASGTDRCGGRFTLARDHAGAWIGKPARPLPALPPSSGTIPPDGPAVRFGASRLAVLTATGHATPGSVFVTAGDGTVCAAVVHGAAVRVRVLCLDKAGESWRLR